MSDENENNGEQSQQEIMEQLTAFVVAEMQTGSDKATIAQKLVDQGVDRGEAEQITRSIYDEVVAMVQKEQFTPGSVGPGLVGGIIAALVGGGVWAGIAIVTDYEIGIIAWAIGGLCGFGVVTAAGGRKGMPLQVIAVVTGVLGIVAGKYFTFYHFMKEMVAAEYGEEAVAEMSVMSADTIRFFVEMVPEMAEPLRRALGHPGSHHGLAHTQRQRPRSAAVAGSDHTGLTGSRREPVPQGRAQRPVYVLAGPTRSVACLSRFPPDHHQSDAGFRARTRSGRRDW